MKRRSLLRWGFPRDAHAHTQLTAFIVLTVATVLVTRGGLAAAGYPSIGGSRLHIAHVLWGGLLMMLALVVQLSFIGPIVQPIAAALGGIGFGLFIDEVGKFVTRDNDYFYRPAVGIMYATVVVLILGTHFVHGRRPLQPAERLANAVYQAVSGVVAGLSAHRFAETQQHLTAAAGIPAAAEAHQLVRALPVGEDDLVNRVVRTVQSRVERILASHTLTWVAVALIVVQAITGVVGALVTAIMAVFFRHLLTTGSDQLLVTIMSISAAASTACLLLGLLRLRHERMVAIEWFQRAVLIDLLVTQLLDSVVSGFRTVLSVFIGLFLLGVLAAEKTRLTAHTVSLREVSRAGTQNLKDYSSEENPPIEEASSPKEKLPIEERSVAPEVLPIAEEPALAGESLAGESSSTAEPLPVSDALELSPSPPDPPVSESSPAPPPPTPAWPPARKEPPSSPPEDSPPPRSRIIEGSKRFYRP